MYYKELKIAKGSSTIRDLEERSGLAHGTIIKILQGKSNVLLSHLDTLAKTLNFEVIITIKEINYMEMDG